MNDTTPPDSNSAPSIPDSNLSRYAGLPTNVASLISFASDLDIKASAFEKKITSLSVDLGTRSERVKAEIERLTDLPKNQRTTLSQKRLNTLRRETVQASSDERYEKLRALKQADDQITIIESQYATPAHLLAREGLGTAERSRYQDQIANSGPLELRNFAAHAVSTGDKVLGSAIMAKLDSLKPQDRKLVGISRQALSEALCGEDHKKAQNAINIVKNRVRQAFVSNREFESGRKNATAKIGLAMSKSRETGPLDGCGDGGDNE